MEKTSKICSSDIMKKAVDRFIEYIKVDTSSEDDADRLPSTQKQFDLARMLCEEMKSIGLENVTVDEQCYVYGFIPENAPGLPALGFIAHMDTVPELSGVNETAHIIKNYDGGDIVLESGLVTDVATYPSIKALAGQDIIVTDGTTLLGADDKAGVAEILTMCEALLARPDIRHGKICIGFTPDEEVGRGADGFDVAGFGADFAYTVDGGPLGELEYENFNAASANVEVTGVSIHPGSAKDKMRNSIRIAGEFDAMLPPFERPEHTEGYEGFYQLGGINGSVEHTRMHYIIRDHDAANFERRKALMQRAADFINARYGEGTLTLDIKDSYYNMREQILPHFHLIETAKAAMLSLGIEPIVTPVRGGTDGARLSYMGLPCPNLCTGGYFCHGQRELIPVQSLIRMSELLLEIVKRTYEGK